MADRLEETIEIPNGVEVNIENILIKIKGARGSLERRFAFPSIKITKEGNSVKFVTERDNRKQKRMMNTFKAHVKNMILGVAEGFKFKLKVCSGHFPISVAVKGSLVEISNFLGEKIPRRAHITDGVSVKVAGDIVLVEGIDIEKAGNTASRIEQATRITNRDRRVFQDGLFIIEKPGVVPE